MNTFATIPTLVPTLDELAVEFERLFAEHQRLGALADANSGDREADRLADEACTALVSLCGQMSELPPQNATHLQTKARALLWLEYPEPPAANAGAGERLAYQLAQAQVEGAPG